MADINIDTSVSTNQDVRSTPRSLVWVSSSVGYIFYLEKFTPAELKYSKTSDSGSTWSSGTSVNSSPTQTLNYAVWFDKWTNGDSGTNIHIAYLESGNADVIYNSLDTSDDSLGGEVTAFNGSSAETASFDFNGISITKSRNGTVFVGGWIDNDGENFFAKGTMSGGVATSFSSKTSMADGNAVDRIMLCAGNETDSEDVVCVYDDVSANELTLKVFDDSANTWSEGSAIEAGSISENSSFWNYDCIDRHSDGHILICVWNAHNSTTGDLEFYDVTNKTTSTTKTNVVTDLQAYSICAILLNQQNDDVYTFYSTGSTSGAIVYKKSTDGGSNWGSETSLSQTSDDHRSIYGGNSIQSAGGRVQACWFNDDLSYIVTNQTNSVSISEAGTGTNLQINIGDTWKSVEALQINIGDVWKSVAGAQINIGDVWKTVY